MAEKVHRGHGFIEVIPEDGPPEYYFMGVPRDTQKSKLPDCEVESRAAQQIRIAEAFTQRSIEAEDPRPAEWFIEKIDDEQIRNRALALLFEQQIPGMILASTAEEPLIAGLV